MDNVITQASWLKQCVRADRMTGGMAAEVEEMLEGIRAEIAQLETDLAEARAGKIKALEMYDAVSQSHLRLEAKLAEAWRDSERLDWLISASHEGKNDYLSDALWDDAGNYYFEDNKSTADCVRAAIDAARGAK